MRAEILSYARSRGLFAGVSLQGAVLAPSGDDNEDLYGKRIDPREVLYEGGDIPKSARKLIKVLEQYDTK
jgi:lipid-binding SYLF domain-containing protein